MIVAKQVNRRPYDLRTRATPYVRSKISVLIMSNSSPVIHIVGLNDQDGIAELIIAEGHVVREFGSVTQFLNSGAAANSGCVVAALDIDNNDGLVLQERLRRDLCTMPLITVGESPTADSVVRTMRNGAAFVFADPTASELILAVAAAHRLDRYRREWLQTYDAARKRLDCLSSRQSEVLTHLAVGKLNKVIARELYLSPRTVEKHRREIHNRLGTSSLAEIAVLVERMKWPQSVVYSLPLDVLEASAEEPGIVPAASRILE